MLTITNAKTFSAFKSTDLIVISIYLFVSFIILQTKIYISNMILRLDNLVVLPSKNPDQNNDCCDPRARRYQYKLRSELLLQIWSTN